MKITKSVRSADTGRTFGCAYHGWVMIPLDLGHGRKLPYSDTTKMVKIGKKVATSQLTARKDGDKATITLSPAGVRVAAAAAPPDSAPLLSASMDTISCMLLSKDTGIAVIMAFTWDHQGQRGVGCDVITFQGRPKKTIKQFSVQFNKAMLLQGKAKARTAKMAATVTGNTLDDDVAATAAASASRSNIAAVADMEVEATGAAVTCSGTVNGAAWMGEAEDDSNEAMPSFSPGGLPYMAAKRRRSSAVNETEGGYLSVDTIKGGNAGYLACIHAASDEDEDDGQYITVRGRRSSGFSYMSVEGGGGGPRNSNSSDVDM